MRYKLKYWAANAVLFVPSGFVIIQTAGWIALNLGALVALFYLLKFLTKPFTR